MLGDGAQWSVTNGVLRQTAEKEFIRALAGDKTWTDYTLTLKARKISGAEGFLVLFHVADDGDRNWWNIAGWGNTQNGVELNGVQDGKPGSVETNRWYDIKVEVKGQSVKCWLDGQLIHDIQKPGLTTRRLYASASRDTVSGDVIVKVVNTAPFPIETGISLGGVKTISGPGRAIVLTSDNPQDENTIDEPTKVSPKTETFDVSSPDFRRTFPGNSFTVLRLKAEK